MTTNEEINEGIIPYGLSWRAGINVPSEPERPDASAGITAGIATRRPEITRAELQDLCRPSLSKQAQYTRDLMNGLSRMPTFGIEDTRPETDAELTAQYHPELLVRIDEPLLAGQARPNEFVKDDRYAWTNYARADELPNIRM